MSKLHVTLMTLVSLVLFIGGILLLISGIKFWSLFLGIPATQTGIVFLILAFEKLTKDTFEENLKPPAYINRVKGRM